MFCLPSWWCRVQGSCTEPCFCSQYLSGSRFVAFYLIAHNCLDCGMHAVIFNSISFFVLCCCGDVCPGASTAVKAPGPSLSQEEFIEALLVSLLPRPRNILKFAFGGGLFL